MQIEHEIKVLGISVEKLRKKLLALGFTATESQAFRRYVYDAGPEGAWLRLRTDGKKTTLAYKQALSDAIDGVRELEIVVKDFDKTHELLTVLGYAPRAYQENRRQTFTLQTVEVSLDEWPLIPPYVEIEAATSQDVEQFIHKLDLDGLERTSLPTSAVYDKYGLNINDYPRLQFE